MAIFFIAAVIPITGENKEKSDPHMFSPWFITMTILQHNHRQSFDVDLFYTDPFIRPSIITDGIRLASTEDITAMKMELIARGGRKKDFWDIHELMEKFTLKEMLAWYQARYPYTYESREILVTHRF